MPYNNAESAFCKKKSVYISQQTAAPHYVCITFPANTHSVLGDEILSYSGGRRCSGCAADVDMHVYGTDIYWALRRDAGGVCFTD